MNNFFHSRKTETKKKSRGRVTYINVNGDCCLKIYSLKNFRGFAEVLLVGHDSGFELSKVKSYKFVKCE